MAISDRVCHYRGTGGDLRPYGPGGAFVCYDCATSSPERNRETESQFKKILDGGDVLLTEHGPVPLKRGVA